MLGEKISRYFFLLFDEELYNRESKLLNSIQALVHFYLFINATGTVASILAIRFVVWFSQHVCGRCMECGICLHRYLSQQFGFRVIERVSLLFAQDWTTFSRPAGQN